MKLLASSILAFSLMGCSLLDNDIATSKVPSVVRNAFEQQYSNPVDVEWEKKKGNYEADFEIGAIDHSALFNKEGELLMAKEDISKAELPSAITAKVAEDYPGNFIDDVDKVTAQGNIFYQMELERDNREIKLVYHTDGQENKDFKYWD